MGNAFVKAETAAPPAKGKGPEPLHIVFPMGTEAAFALVDYLQAEADAKKAENTRDRLKTRLEGFAGSRYVEACARSGEKPGSVTVEAGFHKAAFVVQERATALDLLAVERLREAAGDDAYIAPLMETAVALKFDPDALAERTTDGSQTIYEWLGNRLDVSLRRAVSEGTITEDQRARLIKAERKTVAAKGWISRVCRDFKGRPAKILEFMGILGPSAYIKA